MIHLFCSLDQDQTIRTIFLMVYFALFVVLLSFAPVLLLLAILFLSLSRSGNSIPVGVTAVVPVVTWVVIGILVVIGVVVRVGVGLLGRM